MMRPQTHDTEMALSELLAGRLCHDIAGACGAVVGALEVAMEDADVTVEAVRLAHEMAMGQAARLRLLRAAWGPPGDALDRAGLVALGNP